MRSNENSNGRAVQDAEDDSSGMLNPAEICVLIPACEYNRAATRNKSSIRIETFSGVLSAS
jgi:hypothetical protein